MASGACKLAYCAVLLGAVVLSSVSVTETSAASRVCRRLEADLATASGGGGSSTRVRKYDAAIARQGDEIAKARGQARRAGCGFSLFGRNLAQCADINAAIGRMNGNLDSLRRKRAQLAGGRGSRRDRARIMASLDANGCRDKAAAEKKPPTRKNAGGNLFDQLFGQDQRRRDTLDQPDDPGEERNIRRVINRPGETDYPRVGGEYRTLCVRTCDGYFYPMSNAASLGDFERDQKNCESSCPGTEMQVFYTRGMGDDSANMTSSVTGRPYSELPTAYFYKRPGMSRPPGCGCNAARNFEIVAGNPPAGGQPQAETGAENSSIVSVPAVRPEPAADPQTPATKPGAPAVAVAPDQDRKVRVVGPTFLPDPQEAIDLRVQDPKEVP